MASNQAPLNSAFTRVWLIEGRAGRKHKPEYMGFFSLGGYNWDLGAVEPIYVPSDKAYGKFEEAGTFRGEESRPTTSFVGRYAANFKSRLIQLARAGCAFDLQMHIGKCEDPTKFDAAQKYMVFENVSLESISSDDLGALDPGSQGLVNETGEVSASRLYEIMPMTYASRAGNVITNEIVDVVRAGNQSCGDCDESNSGCQDFYAISLAAGGSPGTPADVVFSHDKGLTWFAHDIDSLGVGDDPSGIAVLDDYVVVVSNDGGDAHIAPRSEFKSGGDPQFVQITNGFEVGGAPNGIWNVGSRAFIVGDGGHVYAMDNPADGVTVIDAGGVTVENLLKVHGLTDDFAVAVGENGTIVIIRDSGTSLSNSPVGAGVTITGVDVRNDQEWDVVTSDGRAFYTMDGGQTWTEFTAALPGTKTAMNAIRRSTETVMYASGVVNGRAALWSSFNGGSTWVREVRGTSIIPLADRINALAVCGDIDADFLVGVGLADNATDGFVIVGSD